MLRLFAGKLLEDQLARSMGLDKYADIINGARNKDVSYDKDFQRSFNAFYRVRRNAEWRDCYYRLFERAKKEQYSFADVIGCLYVETGNVEASFSSKMVATIDPEMPIWDQYVLQNLGLELKGKEPREKIGNAVRIYEQIQAWYQSFLKTDEARESIAEFDRWLPSYTWITDVKKIDYLLWSRREGKNMVGKYKVITLCGSTRFKDAFLEAQKRLTLEGNIVISVGLFGHSGDEEVWTEGTKDMLDDMHRAKIDMADEVFVIDVNNYVGKSTQAEIDYAKSIDKPVRYYSDSQLCKDMQAKKSIEDSPVETFFEDWFHKCKALEFTSRTGQTRVLLEYMDETDCIDHINGKYRYEDMSVKNAVSKLISAGMDDYYLFDKSDDGVYPVCIDGKMYYVKYEDVSKRWPGHYWLRAKRPIIGFKAVSASGGSVMIEPTNPEVTYKVGEEYSFDEDRMLNEHDFGSFFSPSLLKAKSYVKAGYKICLVAASGLIFVKNNWNDLAASRLSIVRKLTNEDIKRLMIKCDNPRGFWNGYGWDSHDEDFAYAIQDKSWY